MNDGLETPNQLDSQNGSVSNPSSELEDSSLPHNQSLVRHGKLRHKWHPKRMAPTCHTTFPAPSISPVLINQPGSPPSQYIGQEQPLLLPTQNSPLLEQL